MFLFSEPLPWNLHGNQTDHRWNLFWGPAWASARAGDPNWEPASGTSRSLSWEPGSGSSMESESDILICNLNLEFESEIWIWNVNLESEIWFWNLNLESEIWILNKSESEIWNLNLKSGLAESLIWFCKLNLNLNLNCDLYVVVTFLDLVDSVVVGVICVF